MAELSLDGVQVAVWGIGVEGQAAARYALRSGAAGVVGVTDTAASDLSAWQAASADATVLTDSDGEQALRSAGAVLRSPGISIHRPLVRELLAAGIPVLGGTAIFLRSQAARSIGVTGSKGKSTTSSLIAHLLTTLERSATLAGNIGTPLLDLLTASAPDHYVLEVSSFQASDIDVSPRVVVLTSLFPDHLDWHGDEATYYADKLNLAAHRPEVVVANAKDAEQQRRLAGRDEVRWYGGDAGWRADGRTVTNGNLAFVLPGDRLIGAHNANNVAAALTALEAVGIDLAASTSTVSGALESFAPLEHRLEVVATIDAVDYLDDSLSTSPHAAIAALEAFPDRPATLIAGGHDRGMSFDPLARHIAARTEWTAVITLPANGPRLTAALESAKAKVTAVDVNDLNAAVELAYEITPPGGVVLLSPAAPSFGQFSNYADRSAAFVASINRLHP